VSFLCIVLSTVVWSLCLFSFGCCLSFDLRLLITTLASSNFTGAVMVVIWQLDFQRPVQSVSITTNVVSSNSAQARCTRYNIM